MTWTEVKLRLRRLLARQRAERDLRDEIDFHFAMQAHTSTSAGTPPGPAERRAEAAFGGADRVLEECRDLRRFGWLEDGWRDLVVGLRRLRRTPVFTLVALSTLALGIGANTALFSLVDAVVLRRLPVAHPEQLISLGDPGWTGSASGVDDHEVSGLTFHQYELIRGNSSVFHGVLAQVSGSLTFGVTWDSERSGGEELVAALPVTANYFSVLGLEPARGRFFDAADDTPAATPDAVMSYAYWQGRFAGSQSVIGQQFHL